MLKETKGDFVEALPSDQSNGKTPLILKQSEKSNNIAEWITFGVLEIIKYTLFCCTFVNSIGTLSLKAWAGLFALLEASVYF